MNVACFLNAVLQTLYNMPALCAFLEDHACVHPVGSHNCVCCRLRRTLRRVRDPAGEVHIPALTYDPEYYSGIQEDVHTFFLKVRAPPPGFALHGCTASELPALSPSASWSMAWSPTIIRFHGVGSSARFSEGTLQLTCLAVQLAAVSRAQHAG